jgi:hypothetical protein
MSDPTPSDDFQHLPTADATDARAAKAALWKEIANRKKQSRMAPTEPPPVEEAPAPEPPLARNSSSDEWAELFAMNSDEAAAISVPLPAAPAPAAKKRSVIRRSTPQVVPTEEPLPPEPPAEPEPIIQQEAVVEPPAQVEPVPQIKVKLEEASAPPKLEDKVEAKSENIADSDPVKAPVPPPPKAAEDESEAPGAEVHFLIALLRQKWVQWGGASLSLSLGIHALILGVGGFLVINQVMLDQAVDFLPGGTKQGQEASQSLEHKIQQKKQPWLKKSMPLRKIAAVGSISEIVLPDEVPDLLDLPSANDMLTSAKLGGAGLGGGGFGKGMGLGAKGGMVFQPLSMFGREIKAKRLAVILDVSSSMAPHLPRVIAELDKVARGSVVVLFPGCGLDSPPKKGLDGEEVYRTNGAEFERFWRMGGMASLADTRTRR